MKCLKKLSPTEDRKVKKRAKKNEKYGKRKTHNKMAEMHINISVIIIKQNIIGWTFCQKTAIFKLKVSYM